MKKLLALLLALVMLSITIVGCSAPAPGPVSADPAQAGAAPAEPVEEEAAAPVGKKHLTMWFFGPAADYQVHMKKVLEDGYNASQNECVLTVEFRNTVDKDIPVALAADSGPDIVYSSGPAFVSVYAQEGKVLNLSDYSAKYGWQDRIQEAMYNACTIDGDLYSIPTSMLFDGFYYSKSLFAEKGWEIPTTIEELEALFDAAIADGLYAAAVGNKGWRPNNDTITSIMVNHFISPSVLYDCLTGAKKFNNPELIGAIAKTQEWYQKGYLAGSDYTNLNSQETLQLVADKRAALAFNMTNYFQFAAQSFTGDLASDLGFAPLPAAYTDKEVHQLAVSSTLAINAATQYPDACAALIDYILTDEFYTAMTAGWPGLWAGALKENDEDTSEITGVSKTFIDAAASSAPAIAAGQFGFHASSFFPPQTLEKWRDIDMVWQGLMTPEEFCASLDAVAEQEIADGLVCPLAKPAL